MEVEVEYEARGVRGVIPGPWNYCEQGSVEKRVEGRGPSLEDGQYVASCCRGKKVEE